MSIIWLTPAALLGLALVAVPIAIHLLVRQQGRRVDYPSLRFLRPSQLAAFRRTSIQDAALLACRVVILVAMVMALAGPVLQTTSRSAEYAGRVARAIVLEPGVSPSAVEDASSNAFVSQTFARVHVVDAVADAARWLAAQPPAAREMVFVGAFRRGSLTAAQLAATPPSTGIRFVRTTGAPGVREVALPVLRARRRDEDGTSLPGRLVIERRLVRLEDGETRVTEGPQTPAAKDLLRIVSAPAEQPLADAALRAALTSGLRWSDPAARILVVWQGADEAAVQQMLNGATAVRMARPVPASVSASAVAAAVERFTAASVAAQEPVPISAEQLQAWSRPPGAVPADARPVDEGDRRWFWGLALGLLPLEQWLRRASNRSPIVEPRVEAHVA